VTALIIDIIGWAGAALILAAYFLLTLGKVRAESATYQAMNLLGAAGFVINSGWHGAIPNAALNVAWAIIAAVALVRLARRARARASRG
jgi:hypothetical protein